MGDVARAVLLMFLWLLLVGFVLLLGIGWQRDAPNQWWEHALMWLALFWVLEVGSNLWCATRAFLVKGP